MAGRIAGNWPWTETGRFPGCLLLENQGTVLGESLVSTVGCQCFSYLEGSVGRISTVGGTPRCSVDFGNLPGCWLF